MSKKIATQVILMLLAVLMRPIADPNGSSATFSQEQVRDAQKREISVAFKLVQVYVTNNSGNPVTDLTAEDFEILDDGKPQKIGHFEKCQLEAAPAGTDQQVPSAPPAPGQPRKFFFVFNYAFIEPAGIIKARKAALDFLDNYVQPSDEVGIVTFSMAKGMTIEEFLTTDHKRIRTLIENTGMKTYAGRADQIAALFGRNVLQFLDDTPVGDTPPAGDQEARDMLRSFLTAEAKSRMANYNVSAFQYVQAMRSLAQGLRLVPGYKNLVLFSLGISTASLFGARTVSAPDTLNSVDDIIKWQDALEAQGGDSRLRETFQKMTEELKASNCPVYAFNVAGTQVANDATVAGGQVANNATAMALDQNALGMRASDTYGNDSLRVLSSSTGGQYYHNTMNLKDAVQKLQTTTGTYYVLGFAVPDVWDGKFHKLKVNVKRKGCKVTSEGGYFNPKPFAQYTDLEKYMQILGLAEGAPVFQEPIAFPAAAFAVPLKDKVAISVFSGLPAERFKAIAGPRAEIVIILFNERNRIAAFQRNPLFIAALTEDTVFHDQVAGLPPGLYDCRVVVRNMDTGRGAASSTTVTVPKAPASPGILLYPAHLFKPGKKARYQGNVGAISAIYPFPMSSFSQVIGDLEPGATKLVAVVPCGFYGIAEPEIDLSGSLVNAQTKKAVPLELATKTSYTGQNVQMLLLEMDFPGLEPGPYALTLGAEEKSAGAKSQAVTNFRVR